MKDNKSKIKFGLTAFVVLLAVMSFVGGASAQTIYVPVDYATIQEAVNAASPGDTVFVHIGTYYEGDSVSITKDRITLQGEDVDRTTIHGKGTAEKVVYVTGDYVNVSGFTVTGGSYGIYVASSNCKVSDNIVDSNSYGIYLDSASDCVLQNNTASNSYYSGICGYDSSNCEIENNIANSNSRGINLGFASDCVIENNIANSNIYGIFLSHLSGCQIENNIANSNDYTGIYLFIDSSDCVIENNIANSNSRYGIDLYVSSNNIITGNTFDANNIYGIHLWSSSTCNTITENNISNNKGYGMYLLDYSGDNEIYHNNFINNNKQAYDHGGFNSWDKGLIIGGNYWSDHVCHGNPSDGTEPYTKIDTNVDAVDNYPFEDPNGWVKVEEVFDTSSGTYPSIMGIHNGTIRPSHKVIASKMYTYACEGTGGHSEWVDFYNSTTGEEIANGTWKGYKGGDYHYITFDKSFTLKANVAYNYTIKTGSYPQIHHTDRLEMDDGVITCTSFVDANEKRYNNWIPAIRLE